jgi:hypothetical protein
MNHWIMGGEGAAAFKLKEHRIDSRQRDRGGHRVFAAGDLIARTLLMSGSRSIPE